MKNLIFLLFLLYSVEAWSQKEIDLEKTKAESFSSRKGSIIEKSFWTVAVLKPNPSALIPIQYPVEVMKLKDLKTSDSLWCLRMSTTYSGTSVTGYIDADELGNVINFLQMMSDKYLLGPPPTNDFEVTYTCDSHFSISLFKGTKGWTIAIYPKSYAGIYFEKDMMPYIISAFKKAREAMK